MSWVRQIKTLFSVSLNMFFYIIWGIASFILLSNKIDYRLFLIALLATFIAQFINSRWSNRLLLIIPILIGLALAYIISSGSSFYFNSIYIIFVIYTCNSFESEEVNYDVYKARGKQAIITILIIGLVVPIIDKDLTKSILKFYIMFVASIIWALREVRSYSYKLKNKNSLKVNIALSLGLLMISIDKVFSAIMSAFATLFNLINIVLGFVSNLIIELLGLILSRPLEYLVNLLRPLFAKSALFNNNNKIIDMKENKPLLEKGGEGLIVPEWITNTLKIFILVALLYCLYKFFVRDRFNDNSDESRGIEEKREKIIREKAKQGSFFKRTMQSLFRPKDFRSQIINVYRKFQLKTFDKGIFKRFMTAKQLENVTKAYIENPEGINKLTEIYNEAKFSKHKVSEENVNTVKENFNRIKKQL